METNAPDPLVVQYSIAEKRFEITALGSLLTNNRELILGHYIPGDYLPIALAQSQEHARELAVSFEAEVQIADDKFVREGRA